MQLYGIVGTSELYVVAAGLEHALPAGAIPLQSLRPADTALLQADGTWKMTPDPVPVEVDIPVGEIDALISAFPTIGWAILAQMGIE